MTNVNGVKALSLDTTVRSSSQHLGCEVANEAVLLSMRDGQYYGLNEVAASIWKLIQGPRTVLELREALLQQYEDVDTVECVRAISRFLEEMKELGLVEYC